ncbi:amidase family protein [Pantoea sp. At-9b]|uniref:amidase family protein n=1 Tax=Pantoea sp. (strain At-9b) TaxID=592316 RepID=UPI0001B3EE4B|nr:amidase family protein [Pantoea sp. At-9b]ADU69129.1 Amidase [Pantoea sp. At-9b]
MAQSGERLHRALLQAYKQRHLNSLSWLAAESALALAAAGSDAPLAGLPLVVKDNIDVAGMPTSIGTALLAEEPVSHSAELIVRLQQAGAIIIGKANMHELASGTSGLNAARGDVRHPFLPGRVVGGSSSGSAAAVAAGIVPASIGTDTGASVRLPASFCGLIGFRPSLLRYPQQGIAPISLSRDTAGILAQRMDDVLALDSAISGESDHPTVALADLRLGVPRAHFWHGCEPAVAAAAEAVLQQLRDRGVTLIEVEIAQVAQLAVQAGYPLASFEMLRDLPRYLQQRGSQYSFAELKQAVQSPDVQALLADAATVSMEQYHAAITHWKPLLTARYQAVFQQHQLDGLIFPTVPLLPPPPAKANTLFRQLIANCEPATVVGLPCISLPLAQTPDGIPVGIELQFAAGEDRRLLAVASVLLAR